MSGWLSRTSSERYIQRILFCSIKRKALEGGAGTVIVYIWRVGNRAWVGSRRWDDAKDIVLACMFADIPPSVAGYDKA